MIQENYASNFSNIITFYPREIVCVVIKIDVLTVLQMSIGLGKGLPSASDQGNHL